MTNRVFLFFSCLFMFVLHSQAYNLRKVSANIKGSIIKSVFQNNRGLMWVGTNAGITTYNGKTAQWLDDSKGVTIINGTKTGEIFIESLYGLRIFDEKSDSIAIFSMFNDIDFSTSDKSGTIFTIQGNGSIYYKTNNQDRFDNIIVHDLISANIKAFFANEKLELFLEMNFILELKLDFL